MEANERRAGSDVAGGEMGRRARSGVNVPGGGEGWFSVSSSLYCLHSRENRPEPWNGLKTMHTLHGILTKIEKPIHLLGNTHIYTHTHTHTCAESGRMRYVAVRPDIGTTTITISSGAISNMSDSSASRHVKMKIGGESGGDHHGCPPLSKADCRRPLAINR